MRNWMKRVVLWLEGFPLPGKAHYLDTPSVMRRAGKRAYLIQRALHGDAAMRMTGENLVVHSDRHGTSYDWTMNFDIGPRGYLADVDADIDEQVA